MQCREKILNFRVLRPRHRRGSKPIEWLNRGIKKKLSSNDMCLVDGEAAISSNHNSEHNPPANTSGMIPPPESPSSASPSSIRSSSREDQETAQEGAAEALSELVSTEEQKMNKQTNNTVSHGVISVIGRRRSMEDAVSIVPARSNVELTTTTPKFDPSMSKDELAQLISYDFFAVYDGRGAYRMAHICKERLHHIVAEQFLLADGEGRPCWKSVMARSFARMDDELREEHGAMSSAADIREAVGAAALVVLISKEEIVVANYGESGVVLSLDSAALPLSRDHKTTTDTKQRIEATEGNVTGDENLEPYVLGTPEVTVHKRSTSDNFLVIASDGLWDVVPNQMACDIVRKCCSGEVISRRVLEGAIGDCASASAAMLVELALARGSKDNISVIVVELELQQVKVNNNNSSCSPST